MKKPFWTKTHLFIQAAARFKDLLYIASQQKDLLEDEINHSVFIAWDREKWYQNEFQNWTCVGMCIAKKPEEKLISISEEGEIWTYVGGVSTEEKIQAKIIRNLTTIDGIPFACGMNREVFKRINDNKWISIHAPKPNKPIVGFEAVAGFSENEIYAVGWNGEIWFFDGNNWEQIKSPTSKILTSIVCGKDKEVYVAGQNGVILKGKGKHFSIISDDTFTDDLFDIAFFNNKVYLSGLFSLFCLNKNKIKLIEFGSDSPSSFGKLTHSEGLLWSVGNTDCFSFNGKKWKRIE